MNYRTFFDTHIHILPGVDDGSKNLQETEQMLRVAKEQGVQKILATPHCYPGEKRYDVENIRSVFEQIRPLAENLEIQLYLGSEVFYRYGIAEEIEQGEVLTMAGSSYVLVEYAPNASYKTIYYGVRDLVENGYFPIIAHMERCIEIFYDTGQREELRKMGAIFQMNAGSLLKGRLNNCTRQCVKLIKNREISFLASDSHNNESRKNRLREAVHVLEKKVDGEIINAITCQNAECIVENKRLII